MPQHDQVGKSTVRHPAFFLSCPRLRVRPAWRTMKRVERTMDIMTLRYFVKPPRKKPGEPTGREALIKGIERKILFVIVGAYPGNAPLCWRHLWADIYKVGLLNIVWQCLFSG